jgi:GDP-D-mannose dehydratase
MLQQPQPDDYVIATGETHTVREFVERAAKIVGFELQWVDEGINPIGIDKNIGKVIVVVFQEFYRPAEVDILIEDSSKAKTKLGVASKS